jgi:type IV pilus assembly protein PilB
MVGQKKSLGEILVDKGVLSEDQLRQARDLQKVAPGDIGRIIVDLGYANDKMVTAARAQELGMPYYDLSRNVPDPDAVRLVPEHLIRRYSVIPIKKDDNGRLVVAVGDPKSSMVALDDIRIVSRLKTLPVLATESDIADAITRAFSGEPNYNPAKPGQAGKAHAKGPTNGARGGSSVPALIKGENLTPARIDGSTGLPVNADGSGDELDGNANPSELANALQNDLIQLGGVDVDDDEESLRDMADDAPIIRIAHTIVQQAIKERATDIHIEPEKRGVRIRFRIDGVLNEIMQVPKHIQAPLISRFKIMADLNIAERRVSTARISTSASRPSRRTLARRS